MSVIKRKRTAQIKCKCGLATNNKDGICAVCLVDKRVEIVLEGIYGKTKKIESPSS